MEGAARATTGIVLSPSPIREGGAMGQAGGGFIRWIYNWQAWPARRKCNTRRGSGRSRTSGSRPAGHTVYDRAPLDKGATIQPKDQPPASGCRSVQGGIKQ